MSIDLASARSLISAQLDNHAATVDRLRALGPLISEMAARIIACLEAGGKILFFGNGGSAADAQHLAAEFVIRFRLNRRALPALALSTDTSILTACANDFGFDTVYSRQIEALGRAGDIAIGISTSGNSPNVVKGLEAAREKGCFTMAFTGEKQSECSLAADMVFQAPSLVTARAQECHLLTGHILCEMVDQHFTKQSFSL